MAKKIYEESNIASIADAIREKTGTETKYKTSEMYAGISEVYEAGKKDEYDMFWDAFQKNGTRTAYAYAFAGESWFDNSFRPKYDIRPIGNATTLLRGLRITEDLPVVLERQGIELDTSKATNLEYFFQSSSVGVPIGLGTVNCTSLITRLTSSFSHPNLRQVKLIINDAVIFYSTFNNATNLVDLELEGTLGTDGLSLSNSKKLTHDSLMSVINALKDYSGTSTTRTVTLGSDNLAKLTDAEKKIATDKGWTLA